MESEIEEFGEEGTPEGGQEGLSEELIFEVGPQQQGLEKEELEKVVKAKGKQAPGHL